MRVPGLGLIALTLMPAVAAGTVPDCKAGSLLSYIELGSDGCAIGGVVVFDFFMSFIPDGAEEIPMDQIMVTPSREDSRPRLEFRVKARASAGEFLDASIAFAVAGTLGRSSLDGIGARITGSSVTGDGVVTVVHSACPGGEFLAPDFCFAVQDFRDITPTNLVTFVAPRESARSGGMRFTPTDFLGVAVDIGVDGGLAGSAALGSAVILLGPSPSDDEVARGFDQACVPFVAAGRDALGGRRRGGRVCA